MSARFEDAAIVSGIGQSQIGRRLQRSDLSLTVDACRAAVADAGLTLQDVDGLVAWPGEHPAPPGFTGPGTLRVKDALGLDLRWHHACVEGPGQGAALMTAMMAVASGLATHVMVYRTVTEATGQYGGGRSGAHPWDAGGVPGQFQWLRPFGSVSAATWLAPSFRRYLHDYGIDREQVGWLAVSNRANAIRRGRAVYPQPLTLEDYAGARDIATPFRLLDCDIPIDGATAIIVSAADRATDTPHPVRFEAVGSAVTVRPWWDQLTDPTAYPAQDVGIHLWSRTSLTPTDVDVAQLYDGFSFLALVWLEALGFCGPGEAPGFLDGGERTSIDGELPLNTSGGQLSEGRLHGYGLFHEACVQLRGQAGSGQVPDAEVAVVAIGGGPLGGAFVLTR